MTDWARDPMGFNLMTFNKPKKEEEKKEKPKPKPKEEKKPAVAAAQPVYYIMPHQFQNQYYVQSFCPMPMFVQQQICSYPAYPMMTAQPAKPAKPAENPVVHVCVNCNEKKKCKACAKAQESKKKYVSKPTFFNPRTLKK